MYNDQKQILIALGATEEGIESAFSSNKYKDTIFVEYVIKRIKKAMPSNIDSWLKLSLRYILKTFKTEKNIPVITGRKPICEKISKTKRNSFEKQKEYDEVDLIKKKWESMSEIDKKPYFDQVKKEKGSLPPPVARFFAFNLFVKESDND